MYKTEYFGGPQTGAIHYYDDYGMANRESCKYVRRCRRTAPDAYVRVDITSGKEFIEMIDIYDV